MHSIRELFFNITHYRGNSLYCDVISSWKGLLPYRNYLQEVAKNVVAPDDALYVTDETDWELYALSRVFDVLICALQNSSHYPQISLNEYITFAQSIGLSCEQPIQFHPFFYEIVDVQNGNDPFTFKNIHYPALLLGDLLINRGGATITLPTTKYQIEEIKSAPLHWTYTRNNRETNDLSHGWGHNSQWRTSFRFDFRTTKGLYYNFVGKHNLNHPDQALIQDLTEDKLTLQEIIELVRYRQRLCSKDKKNEPWPYNYRYCEYLE